MKNDFHLLVERLRAHNRHKRWKNYLKNTSGLLGIASYNVRQSRANSVTWIRFLTVVNG